jgi:Zn-dependent peptidase ImmA (M78 family)
MAISKYERDLLTPDGERLVKLSDALGVAVTELLRPSSDLALQPLSCRWHPLKRRSVRAAAAAQARVAEWLERYSTLEELLGDTIHASVEDLRAAVGDPADPELAALDLRHYWHIGDDAIESVVDVLEDHGIRVLAVPDAAPMNACCYVFNDDRPAIAVSRTLADNESPCPGDRQRFSLAHELGHLVLDPNGPANENEAIADRFAAAFLVPAASALRELGGSRTEIAVAELGLLKRKYGLSMQAWLRRAAELRILSPNAAKAGLSEARAAGWERLEPVEIPFEEPQRLRRLALRAWAEGIVTESRAVELSGCPRHLFRSMRIDASSAIDARACA